MAYTILGVLISVIFTWLFAMLFYRKSIKANEDSTKLLFEQNKEILSLVESVKSGLPPQKQEVLSYKIHNIKHKTESSHPVGVNNLAKSMDYVPAIDRKCHWCNIGFIRNDSTDPTIAQCDNSCGLRLKWSGESWIEMR
jgi:hypothetical protein